MKAWVISTVAVVLLVGGVLGYSELRRVERDKSERKHALKEVRQRVVNLKFALRKPDIMDERTLPEIQKAKYELLESATLHSQYFNLTNLQRIDRLLIISERAWQEAFIPDLRARIQAAYDEADRIDGQLLQIVTK